MIITVEEVKNIMGITSSEQDSKIALLIPFVQDYVINFCNNKFQVKRQYPLNYYYTRQDIFRNEGIFYNYNNTISFDKVNSQILDTDNNLINCGFKAGLDVLVEQSVYNNGIYGISEVAAGYLNLSDPLIADETPNYYVKLSLVQFPKGIKLPVAKMIDIELAKLTSEDSTPVVSERVGNYSVNYGSYVYDGSYPDEILRQLKPWKKVIFV